MLLTRRTLFLLLLDALLLAGATFEPTLFYFAVAYVCIVLLMVLADRRLTPPPSDFELTRTNDQRLSLGADNLVVVRVTHRARGAADRAGGRARRVPCAVSRGQPICTCP